MKIYVKCYVFINSGINLQHIRSNTMSTVAQSDSILSSYDNMDFISSSEGIYTDTSLPSSRL